MYRFLFLAVIAFLALVPRAAMAQSAPSASVSTVDEAYVGDQIPFQIVLKNAGDATPLDLAAILEKDWFVQYNGEQRSSSSNMTVIINGRVQQQTSSSSMALSYTLIPRRAGTFTVPALEVKVQGKTLRTTPVNIKVSEPTSAQGLGTSVEVARAYVGQAFKLTLSWVLASAAEDPSFNLDLPEGAFDVRPIAPTAAQSGGPRQVIDVEFNEGAGGGHGVVRGTLSQVSLDGETRSKFTAEFLLVPKQAGKFECGAARVDFRAVVGQKERSVFDAPWDRKTITQRRYAIASAKSVEVLELPTAGKPADFSGLVGQYELHAECQPRQSAVGDPLNLNLVLRSKLPLTDPPTIDLTRQRGGGSLLADQFRVPRDPLLPQVADDTAIYSAQIRPRNAKLTEVPPVELWYFDPVEVKYRVAKSNRIPLKVTAAPVVGLGALEGLDDEPADGAHSEELEPAETAASVPEKVQGFFPPLGTASSVTVVATTEGSSRMKPVLIGSLAIPTGLWFAGSMLAARRRTAERDPAAWRRRGAIRRAKRSLRRASEGSPAVISRSLRAFVSDWFNLPPDAVTTGDAVEAVQGLHPVLASRTRAILDACDQRLFGPDPSSAMAANLATEAATVVREIARTPRGVRPAAAGGGGVA